MDPGRASTQPTQPSVACSEATSATATQLYRTKDDPGWVYAEPITTTEGKTWNKCTLCGRVIKGGGIRRVKEHLAGEGKQVTACLKVTHDVRERFKALLASTTKTKPAVRQRDGDGDSLEQDSNTVVRQRTSGSTTPNFFASRTTPGAQPSIRSALAGKEAKKNADITIAKWFYDAKMPFNAAHSNYYQLSYDAVAAIGPGYKVPSYHQLRVTLLKEVKKECTAIIQDYRRTWEVTGCTLMADGWTDMSQRSLINFLVYCPKGVCFIKSVDASDMVKTGVNLAELFVSVIDLIGPRNVVHFVTDNAANYVAAGKLINEKYNTVFWSPCMAHVLNLLLQDIYKMSHVSNLASRAQKISVFVYSHLPILSFMKKLEGWKQIARPGATRFATHFICLKSIYDHRTLLEQLVTSNFFASHKLGKSKEGKQVKSTVLDNNFWQECLVMVKLTLPIVKLLRIVDSDEQSSLGYVYDGMLRIKNTIKNTFMGNGKGADIYLRLIDAIWDKHLRRSLYGAAYFLNPIFQYTVEGQAERGVQGCLIDLLETEGLCDNIGEAIREIRIYRERIGSFGKKFAISCATTLPLAEWWTLFGEDAPNLRQVAIRILSQTSASSGCERNWSVFYQIHSKRRNRLEHQRLNDLVYVTYNLRLKDRCLKKLWKDPIDYEQLDKIDFWIVEEDPPADIDYEEIERALYEEEELELSSSSGRPRVEEDFSYELTDQIDFDISQIVEAMDTEMDAFIFEDV